jgi:DNA mismatch repair endonuclease MutH
MNSNLDYSKENEGTILARASLLIGKNFEDISNLSQHPQGEINNKNKGNAGNFIEQHWFGIKNNSTPEPDFSEAGIELKVCPLRLSKKTLVVKERTKICSINYLTLVDETWNKSHAKRKLNKVLFIFYEYSDNNWQKQKVINTALWELPSDESIIESEWGKTKQTVVNGLAYNLTERGYKVLSPSRSGSGGKDGQGNLKDLVEQPNSAELALKRAFSLKRPFVNQFWESLNNPERFESISDVLDLSGEDNLEQELLNKIERYVGKTIGSISKELNIPIPNAKNAISIIINKIIGFHGTKSKIKEFEQAGILIKTIPIRMKDLKPYEAISFPAIKFLEFEVEKWNDSLLSEQLTRIFFVPVSRNKSKGIEVKDRILERPFFWSPSVTEENTIVTEWLNYQSEVCDGKSNITKHYSKKGTYREITGLSKESNTDIIHMRPHGRDRQDRDEDSFGNSFVKHSFWLNKVFIKKLAEQHLISR